MDPNTIFYLGTERTTMNSLVPFLSVPQGRTGLKTRPDMELPKRPNSHVRVPREASQLLLILYLLYVGYPIIYHQVPGT